ncbi:MAG: hypothetical protein ACLR4Z_06615 [Butyricicoccaceae bacterium]
MDTRTGHDQAPAAKELDRQAVLFEEKCRNGQVLDGNIKFAEFAEKWFVDYAEKQLRPRTVGSYREMLPASTRRWVICAWTDCSRIISFRFITIWLK